jgi:hypothetical protein
MDRFTVPFCAVTMSRNTARFRLKPTVLTLAMLSPVTVNASLFARMPETPIVIERRMLIGRPYLAASLRDGGHIGEPDMHVPDHNFGRSVRITDF